MRLIVTIAWLLAALMWLPWALILLRWAFDLALGIPISESLYTAPALMGVWPGYSWLSWRIVSWYPVCAVLGIALCAAGWRLFWWSEDYRITQSPLVVAVSILVPVLAPFIMWRDALVRHRTRQAGLHADAADALRRQQASR